MIRAYSQQKLLEKSLDEDDIFSKYNSITNELDAIYDHFTESIRIRSKCDWYEHNKKTKQIILEFRKTMRSS